MRQPTRLQQLGLVLLAAVGGLFAAEGVAWLQADGAFPHANFYVPDAALGVRLEPGATMRFRLGDNPRSAIRVNAEGYRGGDWPAPSAGEVLVVGDSQVFGLGVEGDETFSARLSEKMGRTVLNAGVPTYGPAEYAAVALEVVRSRPVSQVVLALNLSNDLFELGRPNRERHAVWDGWAVRVETAPASVVSFPGRRWLFRSSHLVYAARRWLAVRGPQLGPGGMPSEGVWQDLVASAAETAARTASAEQDASVRSRAAVTALQEAAEAASRAVDKELLQAAVEQEEEAGWQVALALGAARGHPGDIVADSYAEASRNIALTANLIRKAARHRKVFLAKQRGDATLDAAVAREVQALAAVDAAERSVPLAATPSSVVAPFLAELRVALANAGVELVVVVLPLDLQVDPREWSKYGVAPVDMSETLLLNDDIVRDAERLGMRALDTTAALAAAGRGAFLQGDLHMTAKGHEAVADALMEVLVRPRPLSRPAPGLPAGRTVVPSAARWVQTPEAVVRGSSRARCETVRIDEWLRVACLRDGGLVPAGVEVLSGASPDTLALQTRDATTLVTPLTPGEALRARFHWTAHHQDLVVTWEGGVPDLAFGPRTAPGRPAEETALQARLCACQAEATGEQACENQVRPSVLERLSEQSPPPETAATTFARAHLARGSCTDSCRYVLGEASQSCSDRFFDDCTGLLRCVAGEPGFAAPCSPGQARVAGARQCRTLCDAAHPCAAGTCVPYQGSGVCVEGAG